MTATAAEKELTTAEAAEALGVSANVLRSAAAAGWVTPRAEGKGNGRRLFWSRHDLDQMRALHRDQESGKSMAEALIDSLGGEPFVAELARGRKLLEGLRDRENKAVLVGASGVRVVQRASLVREAVTALGDEAIVLLT